MVRCNLLRLVEQKRLGGAGGFVGLHSSGLQYDGLSVLRMAVATSNCHVADPHGWRSLARLTRQRCPNREAADQRSAVLVLIAGLLAMPAPPAMSAVRSLLVWWADKRTTAR